MNLIITKAIDNDNRTVLVWITQNNKYAKVSYKKESVCKIYTFGLLLIVCEKNLIMRSNSVGETSSFRIKADVTTI